MYRCITLYSILTLGARNNLLIYEKNVLWIEKKSVWMTAQDLTTYGKKSILTITYVSVEAAKVNNNATLINKKKGDRLGDLFYKTSQ